MTKREEVSGVARKLLQKQIAEYARSELRNDLRARIKDKEDLRDESKLIYVQEYTDHVIDILNTLFTNKFSKLIFHIKTRTICPPHMT